jgi:transposase-like protein/IS1 family transposase
MAIKESKRIYSCPHCCKPNFKKRGYYYRQISKTYIPRYLCLECKRSFSTRTNSLTFKQKRPDLNSKIYKLITSGVTFNRTAQVLQCDYKTVYRKFYFLSDRAKGAHFKQTFNIKELQFDEMESIEHTKLKPLTIALAVSDDYKILGVKVGKAPAKGHLSKISKAKYGSRVNQSEQVLRETLNNLKSKITSKNFVIKSDAKPLYKSIVKDIFPSQAHLTFIAEENKEKKREMKYTNLEKRIYDPIFALNQRMAKCRDHIKRLTRRSWCTTKRPENLERHLYLYVAMNNGYEIV